MIIGLLLLCCLDFWPSFYSRILCSFSVSEFQIQLHLPRIQSKQIARVHSYLYTNCVITIYWADFTIAAIFLWGRLNIFQIVLYLSQIVEVDLSSFLFFAESACILCRLVYRVVILRSFNLFMGFNLILLRTCFFKGSEFFKVDLQKNWAIKCFKIISTNS